MINSVILIFLSDSYSILFFVSATSKKLPPPPGCVDQQFTSLTAVAAAKVPVHSELPPAKGDIPYALQVLLDLYREQFLSMVDFMKSNKFRQSIENQIAAEKVYFLIFIYFQFYH